MIKAKSDLATRLVVAIALIGLAATALWAGGLGFWLVITVIALNYGAQAEILAASRRLAEQVRDGTLDAAAIDEARFEAELETADLPPLDLLIRTSGEHRLSNFLLWQAAYAELLFVDTLWPDFDEAALAEALDRFGQRQRRFGGL